MPDLTGMTYDQAREAMESVGLYLEATGAGQEGTVFSQSVDPGAPLEVGTAVEVKFTDIAAEDEGLSPSDLWNR